MPLPNVAIVYGLGFKAQNGPMWALFRVEGLGLQMAQCGYYLGFKAPNGPM